MDYKEKYLKYKKKYIQLKTGGIKCKPTLSSKRQKSNCDRLIYKGDSNIKFSKYDVITENEFETIKFSDHKMIVGKFIYNEEKYEIYSWNMNTFDKKYNDGYKDLLNNQISNYFKKNSIDSKYLIFSFQESIVNSLFIKTLIDFLKKLDIHLIKHVIYSSLLDKNYTVQLLLFSTDIETEVKEFGKKKFMITDNIKDTIKSLAGTKSYVYLNINDLMIIGTHFPIDTKKTDLGNNLREIAFNKLQEEFKKYENLIIIGDLNFRNLNNIDQLDTLLEENQNFAEPSKLKQPTCKYNNCVLKCDNTMCQEGLKK